MDGLKHDPYVGAQASQSAASFRRQFYDYHPIQVLLPIYPIVRKTIARADPPACQGNDSGAGSLVDLDDAMGYVQYAR